MGAGRMRVHGAGRQQKQNKRAATTFQDKLAVIQHYETTRDMQNTVRKFYPELSETERRAKARVVYRWIQLKDTIAMHANSAKTKNHSRIRSTGSATTLGADGERELVTWIRERHQLGEQVSSEMLRSRALEIAKARGVPDGAFAASGTWQKSFIERNKQHLRDKDKDKDKGSCDDVNEAAAASTLSRPAADSLLKPAQLVPSAQLKSTTRHDINSSSLSESLAIVAQASEHVRQDTAAATRSRDTSLSSQSEAAQPQSLTPLGLSRAPASQNPQVPSPVPDTSVVAPAEGAALAAPLPSTDAEPPAAASTSVSAPAAISTPVTAPVEASTPAPAPVSADDDPDDRETKRRKAEIEARKAELLNESIRCDNVLKRLRIAEESMLARKRLRDAGIAQDEIDALLPIHRS